MYKTETIHTGTGNGYTHKGTPCGTIPEYTRYLHDGTTASNGGHEGTQDAGPTLKIKAIAGQSPQ